MSGETPLLAILREAIGDEGPIGIDRFMALALGHPRHGYYMTRDPFGTDGDFTTAPEISQMFGELIGLWCVAMFEALGSPARFTLVELGPGRGTLMADLLRAARLVPAFGAAAEVHLVETSPVLRARQAATLAAAGIAPSWHAKIDTLPPGPMLVVANEFFDALPVRHYLRATDGWRERLVGIGPDGSLGFGAGTAIEPALTLAAPEGTLLEAAVVAQTLAAGLAGRIAAQGGAGLIVDYGYATSRFGVSLQALRGHRPAGPLADPGEADLTTHVDFAGLARAARSAGAVVHGPVMQGDFLRELGIEARAARLGRSRPDEAGAIAGALERLTAPTPGMGELFKVLAITAPGLASPPGFAAP